MVFGSALNNKECIVFNKMFCFFNINTVKSNKLFVCFNKTNVVNRMLNVICALLHFLYSVMIKLLRIIKCNRSFLRGRPVFSGLDQVLSGPRGRWNNG